jgi:hypothetical protein
MYYDKPINVLSVSRKKSVINSKKFVLGNEFYRVHKIIPQSNSDIAPPSLSAHDSW